MSRYRTRFLVVMAALGTLTACSSPPGDKLEGKEAKTTGCDQPNVSVVEKEVNAGPTRGLLAIHKSTAAGEKCDRIYWGHFTPDLASEGAFTVSLQRNDSDRYAQKSEPSDPTIVAYTVVTHGEVGDHLAACLTTPSDTTGQCIETTVV